MPRLSLFAPLPFILAGCVPQPVAPVAMEGPAPAVDPGVEVQLTIAPEDEPAPPQASGPVRLRLRDPVPFPIGAGYGALARVDFSGCHERGLPAGYMHVHATFNRVGYVARASVESPTVPPPTALDCIADGLRQTGVPAFDGTDVRLSRTYFVAPGAQPAEAAAATGSAGSR